MRDLLDRQLGRITTYRLVTLVLLALAAVTVAHTAGGTFSDPFTVRAELVTLGVLLASSYVANRLLGLAWRITPHGESSIITALLLWFLFWPTTRSVDLAWLAGAAVLANASKYALAWRGRHVLNPAAAGAFLVVVVQHLVGREAPVNATWWVASQTLLPYVAVGAFLVLWRTRRLDLGLLFVAVAGGLTIWGFTAGLGLPFDDALRTTAYSVALVFIAGFMLSEPLTLPPRRRQQLLVSGVVAVVISYPVWISLLDASPVDVDGIGVSQQLALLVGNLVAFAFARRHGVTLVLEGSRALTPETRELTFRPRRPVTFRPGQYAELTVPHAGVDSRGSRRSFSISSPPAEDGLLTFALRVPEKSSSFKRALLALEPGDAVHATGIVGDFVLPADPATPVLLVAGGIGVTPFLSQLRHGAARDAVVVYGVSSPDEVPFTEELSGARVVLVGPAEPDRLPDGWTYVEAPFLSVDLIAEAVPDLADRRAYVSGPPAMVNAVRGGLAKRCKGVRTDYFTGY
jgi:glycine betaine catabolism B